MAFGIEFRNKDDKLIIDGTAKCMHYWGKVTVTVTAGNVDTDIPLFNIPVTKNIRVYSVTRKEHNPVLVVLRPYLFSGVYNYKIMPSLDTNIIGAIVDIYVFVDASVFASTGQWGLEIKTPSGDDVAFVSARPLLSAQIMANYIFFNYQSASPTFNLTRLIGRYAVMMYVTNRWVYRDNDFTWKNWEGSPCVWWHTNSSGDSFWRLDGNVWRVRVPFSQTTSRKRITEVIRPEIIDADFYDQFTSLGNYVP